MASKWKKTRSNMSEPNFNVPEHTTTTKPRLSLISSKQSGIVLKSEDQPSPLINTVPAQPDDYVNIVNSNPNEKDRHYLMNTDLVSSYNLEKESQISNRGAHNNDQNKMNISKEDLIRLLSLLKSELQSKEIALAAIKCEQLKRLINPVEISRSSLANTYIELQDRFKAHDQNNNSKEAEGQPSSPEEQKNGHLKDTSSTHIKDHDNDENDRESLNILNTLLELLDRHPLLALPRDSIYCLDYNCNELSTKNYLNLKIQHLDNLINQHRRFRYYMNERLKRSEQRSLDLTRELESERNSKFVNEKSVYKSSGKATLLRHIDELKESLEKEKKDKHDIVMTLLNELLDEKERTEALEQKLAEHQSVSAKTIKKSAGEKEKLLIMETELNNLGVQLKKQSMVFSKERSELQSKIMTLEAENESLRTKLEQQDKRLGSLGKSGSTDTKESQPVSSSSVIGRSSVGPKQPNSLNKQQPVSGTQETVTRNTASSTTPKPSPPAKTSTASNATQVSSSKLPPHSISSNGNSQSFSTTRQATSSATKTAVPPIVNRLIGGSGAENVPVRIQPLFKSASVSSTNQQVRNLKTSVSTSGTGGSTASPTTRVSNQPVTKPQVPAKPAQLLDQQRSSLN